MSLYSNQTYIMSFSRIFHLPSKIPYTHLLSRFSPAKRFYSSKNTGSSWRTNHSPLMTEKSNSSSHSWKSYIIPTAAIGGIGGVVLLLHYNDERRVILKGNGPNIETRKVEAPVIGGPFTLIDTEHRVVTDRDLLGNWVLLYFGYTSSPDVGPRELQKTAKAIESKQLLKILPVFVTLDPQRDTPSHLRAYLREFNSRIIGLTGPVSEIRQIAQEYRVFFRKVEDEGSDYLVETSHNMYLLNPNMEIVRCFGVEYSAEQLSEDILKEFKKAKAR